MGNGKEDITVLAESTDEKVRDYAQSIIRKNTQVANSVSPLGTMGLPRLLDERRVKYKIPDGAFRVQVSFDRCFVYQIAWNESDMYGDTLIAKSEQAKERERLQAPLGIIIGAGLRALDELRSNGIDLGHVVTLLRVAPFRMIMDMVAGHEVQVLCLRAGDLTGSEDLRKALLERRARILTEPDDNGILRHYFCDENGKKWNPSNPDSDYDS